MEYENINGMKYITIEGMQAASNEALACVRIIRQWLPIKGKHHLSSITTIDEWFSSMAESLIAFQTYHPVPGRYATIGPKSVGNYWRELCEGMLGVRDHYKLQDVDGVNRLPFSDVRGGKKIRPIDEALIVRVEQAANAIIEMKSGVDEAPPAETIIDDLLEEMSKQERMIFEFLSKQKRAVSYDSIRDKCRNAFTHGNDASDVAIKQAVKRLQKCLNDNCSFGYSISDISQRVKIDRLNSDK